MHGRRVDASLRRAVPEWLICAALSTEADSIRTLETAAMFLTDHDPVSRNRSATAAANCGKSASMP
jgi:hypothetical protein